MGFAFVGGMSGSWGVLTDNQGGRVRVKLANANIGLGLSAGWVSYDIYVTEYDPDGIFTIDDFLHSYTNEFEGGFAIFNAQKAWQAQDDLTSKSIPWFTMQGGGIVLGGGGWWSRSVKTGTW